MGNNIVINEASQTYSYNIGSSSYSTVALPIMSCWGPGIAYEDEIVPGGTVEYVPIEDPTCRLTWQRFPATQAGLESFVSTYRGPIANYRSLKDNSYQMAMTLLTSGYDILTCRVSCGLKAKGGFVKYAVKSFTGDGTKTAFVWSNSGTGPDGSNIKYVKVTKNGVTTERTDYTYAVTTTSSFTGDGTTTTFTIPNPPASITDIKVNGTLTPSSDYSYNATTGVITFTSAPPAPTNRRNEANIVVTYPGVAVLTFATAPESNSAIDVYYITSPVGADPDFVIKGKYNGTFGNNLKVVLSHKKGYNPETKLYDINYYNCITYILDSAGIQNAVENLTFVFNQENETEDIPHISDVESNFLEFASYSSVNDGDEFTDSYIVLSDGTDGMINFSEYSEQEAAALVATLKQLTIATADLRYAAAGMADASQFDAAGTPGNGAPVYLQHLYAYLNNTTAPLTPGKVNMLFLNEFKYSWATYAYDLLKDKLNYNPRVVISPGWDDQDIAEVTLSTDTSVTDHFYNYRFETISPLHVKLMEVSYYGRCARAYLDVPKSLRIEYISNESTVANKEGYLQMLARFIPVTLDVGEGNSPLFSTHGGLYGPWGQFRYAGSNKFSTACPAFITLMIERAQIKNQAIQYEWALPTNRSHTLVFGKFDYAVSKKYLDKWQQETGVGMNAITNIPGLGITVWGNSTLFEVPPASYQALANMSTRKLMNAIEDVVYAAGVAITYTYNNQQAYDSFYAACVPTLDAMINVGAINSYYVRMSSDIDSLGQVKANSVVGKIYITVNGVIKKITVDLIALPPTADLTQYTV